MPNEDSASGQQDQPDGTSLFILAFAAAFVVGITTLLIYWFTTHVRKSIEPWDTAMHETDYLLTTQFNIGVASVAPADCKHITMAVYMRDAVMDDFVSVLEEYHDKMNEQGSPPAGRQADPPTPSSGTPSEKLDDVYDNMLLQIIGQPMSNTIEFNKILDAQNDSLVAEDVLYQQSDVKKVDTSRGDVQSIVRNMNDLANGGRPVAYVKMYYNGRLQENTDFMVVGILWHHDVLASYRDLQNLRTTCSHKTKTCPELSQTAQLRAIFQGALLQSQTTINLGMRVFEKRELKLLSSCLRNKMLQIMQMTTEDSTNNHTMVFLADHLYALNSKLTRSLHLGSSLFVNRDCASRTASSDSSDLGGINALLGMSDEHSSSSPRGLSSAANPSPSSSTVGVTVGPTASLGLGSLSSPTGSPAGSPSPTGSPPTRSPPTGSPPTGSSAPPPAPMAQGDSRAPVPFDAPSPQGSASPAPAPNTQSPAPARDASSSRKGASLI